MIDQVNQVVVYGPANLGNQLGAPAESHDAIVALIWGVIVWALCTYALKDNASVAQNRAQLAAGAVLIAVTLFGRKFSNVSVQGAQREVGL